jgi:methylenetetrahydrofolate reductase (NADH)
VRIDEIIAAGGPVFSFEFFPPKTEAGERNLYAALAELRELRPSFVSVTYGAGGSTREKTIEIVKRIRERYGLEAMAHFTCVGATVAELRATLDDMLAAGIDNVLALRGDPPAGQEEWIKTDGGLEYSHELVALISAHYPFAIGAACFPETHIHAASPEADLAYLAEKVAAGVDFLITQLFFDNAFYFDFVGRARAAGIEVPIIPGIMPITHAGQVQRMASLCGASIPDGLGGELAARVEHPEAVLDFGVAYATLQCSELLAGGAPGIHFYTLNRSPATRAILSALKLARPWGHAGARDGHRLDRRADADATGGRAAAGDAPRRGESARRRGRA